MTMEDMERELEQQLNERSRGKFSVSYTAPTDYDPDHEKSDVLYVVIHSEPRGFCASEECGGTDNLWEATRVPPEFDDSVGREHLIAAGVEMFRYLRKGSGLWRDARRREIMQEMLEWQVRLNPPYPHEGLDICSEAGLPIYDSRIRFNEGVLPADAVLMTPEEAHEFVNYHWFRQWQWLEGPLAARRTQALHALVELQAELNWL